MSVCCCVLHCFVVAPENAQIEFLHVRFSSEKYDENSCVIQMSTHTHIHTASHPWEAATQATQATSSWNFIAVPVNSHRIFHVFVVLFYI